jgi:hypothetical protein
MTEHYFLAPRRNRLLYLVTIFVVVSQGCNPVTEEPMRKKPAEGDMKPTACRT